MVQTIKTEPFGALQGVALPDDAIGDKLRRSRLRSAAGG
jgi:hypothetical protein